MSSGEDIPFKLTNIFLLFQALYCNVVKSKGAVVLGLLWVQLSPTWQSNKKKLGCKPSHLPVVGATNTEWEHLKEEAAKPCSCGFCNPAPLYKSLPTGRSRQGGAWIIEQSQLEQFFTLPWSPLAEWRKQAAGAGCDLGVETLQLLLLKFKTF